MAFPVACYPHGQKSSSAFSPLAVSSLVEWWSIDDLASVGDGNPISSWVGRKAGITPVATLTARPTYVANAGGGLPALVPDGVDDSMDVTLLTDVLTYFPNSSLEVWAVMYAAASGENTFDPINSAGGSFGRWLPFSDNTIYFDHPAPGTGRISVGIPSGWASNWHVVRFAKAGSARQIEVDGVQIQTGTAAPTFTSSATTLFRICATNTTMKLRQLLLFNQEVTGADLTALRTYLNTYKT